MYSPESYGGPNPRADETIYCVRVALGAQPFDLGCVVIAGIVGPGDRAVAFNLLAWLSRPQQLDINANGQPMQDTSKQQNY